MLIRIIRQSISRRKQRKLLSLAAITLGITVGTVVATLALDVGDKINRELRSFGANISVTPAADGLPVVVGGVDYRPAGAGAFLAEADLSKIKKIFWRNNVTAFAPFLYVPARAGTVSGSAVIPVILVGTWFDHKLLLDRQDTFATGLNKLHPEWRIAGAWPRPDTNDCLVGRRLAEALSVRPGDSITLPSWSHPASLGSLAGGLAGPRAAPERVYRELGFAPAPVAAGIPGSAANTFKINGILDSGGQEDNQILAPLSAVQRLAGLDGKVRRIEVSALTKPEDDFARRDPRHMSPEELERWSCSPYARSIAYQIQEAIPGAHAEPVLQVAETEGVILDRTGILMWILVAAGLSTAVLAVASMMLATVLERRTEIALFKALGATDTRVATVFLLEASLVGLAGGVGGCVAGSLMARRVAISVFGTPGSVHWVILVPAVLVAISLSLAGSALPLARALKLSPAGVLRG